MQQPIFKMSLFRGSLLHSILYMKTVELQGQKFGGCHAAGVNYVVGHKITHNCSSIVTVVITLCQVSLISGVLLVLTFLPLNKGSEGVSSSPFNMSLSHGNK